MTSKIIEKMKKYSKSPRAEKKLVIELDKEHAAMFRKIKEELPSKITNAGVIRGLIKSIYEAEFLEKNN